MSNSSPRIGVTTELNERAGLRLREVAPEADVVLLHPDGSWSANPDHLDGFFFSEDLYYLPDAAGAFISLLDTARPGWMQTASTGVDHAIFAHLIDSGSIVTNSPGVHGGPIAEYVFAYILSHAKRLPLRPNGSGLRSTRSNWLVRLSASSATAASARPARGSAAHSGCARSRPSAVRRVTTSSTCTGATPGSSASAT